MKLRTIAILGSILVAGSLSAQTQTDVINEFNQVLSLAEVVGDSANELKEKAELQIPLAYYRQATLFLKRKQFDNAIPYLEQTIEFSKLYNNNEESSKKAGKYLLQSYMREGQRNFRNKTCHERRSLPGSPGKRLDFPGSG